MLKDVLAKVGKKSGTIISEKTTAGILAGATIAHDCTGALSKIVKRRVHKKIFTSCWHVDNPKYFRISQISGMCQRQAVFFKLLGNVPVEIQQEIEFDAESRMSLGTSFHDYIQTTVLGPMGVLKGNWLCKECFVVHKDCFYPSKCSGCGHSSFQYEEYTLYNDEMLVCGHIDGILSKKRLAQLSMAKVIVVPVEFDRIENDELAVLEIKSTSSFGYQKILSSLEPPEYYKVQALFYQKALGLTETVFFYYDRDSGGVVSFSYKFEQELYDFYFGKMKYVLKCIEEKRLPEDKVCLTMKDGKKCNCPFVEMCFRKVGEELV